MRAGVVGAAVLVAVLFPNLGNAQAFSLAEQPPQVTAAGAPWLLSGGPIVYAGDLYYPTGPTVFFDPHVMVRTGAYAGIALYADATLEPYSVVYVPIGGNVMRPYEKRRAGSSEGTIGSRTPSFPVERDADVAATTPVTGLQFPPPSESDTDVEPAAVPVATIGRSGSAPRATATGGAIETFGRPRATRIESVPPPRSNVGIWLRYDGAKWYAAGAAVPFATDRFVEVGDYRGFPVFRDKNGDARTIYVPSVEGGALTPYRRSEG